MRASDKKNNIIKANLLAEQRHMESKGFINESEIRTAKRNFIVGDSAYITGDLYDLEVSPISSGGNDDWVQVRGVIPLRDFYKPDAVIGSKLKYLYNSNTGVGKLLFNYNFSKWEQFFDVVDPKFHTPFKRMLEALNQMAVEKVREIQG